MQDALHTIDYLDLPLTVESASLQIDDLMRQKQKEFAAYPPELAAHMINDIYDSMKERMK